MTTTAPPLVQATTDDLVGRLELAFRLLGRRVYGPSLRALRASHGVDKTSFPLLAFLEESGPSRPSDAATGLELDLSTVSRQVRALEQSGLLDRQPDEADGRACRIDLTAAGRDGLEAVRAARSDLLDAALADWSDDDRADLLRLLDRLLTSVRDTTHPAPAPMTTAPAGPLALSDATPEIR